MLGVCVWLKAGCSSCPSKRCAWKLAVASELFSSPHSVCGHSLPPLAACGWDAVVLGPCASSLMRGTGAATLRAPLTWGGLVSKGFRPTSARCHWRRAPWHLLAVEVSWFMTPVSSRVFCVARLRPLTPAAVAACADQVPRGQRPFAEPLTCFRVNRVVVFFVVLKLFFAVLFVDCEDWFCILLWVLARCSSCNRFAFSFR